MTNSQSCRWKEWKSLFNTWSWYSETTLNWQLTYYLPQALSCIAYHSWVMALSTTFLMKEYLANHVKEVGGTTCFLSKMFCFGQLTSKMRLATPCIHRQGLRVAQKCPVVPYWQMTILIALTIVACICASLQISFSSCF